jgi:sensor histidine kinase YesM
MIIGYFAYSITQQSVREKTTSAYQGTLRQIRDNVVLTAQDMKRISDQLYLDQNLQENLRWSGDGWSGYEMTTKVLIPKLQNTIKGISTPIWLSVYLENRSLPEIFATQNKSSDPMKTKSGSYELYHLDRIEGQSWYQLLPLFGKPYNPAIVWRQVDNDEAFRNVSLLRRLDDAYETRQIGFIRMTVKTSDLFKAVDANKGEGISHLFVFDENHHVLYASDQGHAAQQTGWKVPSDRNYLTLEERIPEENWSIAAYISNEVFQKDANKVRNLTILVCLGSFLFLALLSNFVSRWFAKRVRKIVSVLSAFREGDFHYRMNISGNDEFSQIASALNQMGQNTDQLIREVYITNIQKREAELTALQAQINPHFLYNTLSSISRLAQFGENEKLHEMVMALAKFYRMTLNEGRTIISIDNELQQVKAYIDIQTIKYKDRLDVSYMIEPEVLQFDTVKLILQPFIENVLEHSWFGNDRIHLKLWAFRQEGNIIFKIIDDGVGMQPKTIQDIFNKESIQVGYGIRNVDERIKLQFGKEYGVQIASSLGIGTSVQIMIPEFRRD